MVRRRRRERSLFEVLLPDGHKLWPDGAVRSATPRIATNASAEARSRRRRRREIISRIATYRWLTRQARRPSVTINIAPITMINEPSRRRRMLRSAK